jgi:hypothetical protein
MERSGPIGGIYLKIRRNHVKVLLLFIVILLTVMTSNMMIMGTGSPGGRGSAYRDYNCSDSSCHVTRGSSTMRMSASNSIPHVGEVIEITVTVTGSEASNSPMGVFLLRSLTASYSQPAVDGWEIISDPSGSTSYNYYERYDVNGGDTWVWTLRAPEEPGNYRLYAREHNGNDNSFWNDHTTGLSINVGAKPDVSGDPESADETFFIILIVFILTLVPVFYILHLKQERTRAKSRKASRKRSKSHKVSRSTRKKPILTTCDVCGCSLKEENLDRHLTKVHHVSLSD